MNEELQYLLDYLDKLSKLHAGKHFVNDEIKEAIRAIRLELGLEQVKQKQTTSSAKLVFDSAIGKTNVTTDSIFNAVVNRKEKETVVYYERATGATTSALKLAGMYDNVHVVTSSPMASQVDNERVHGYDKTTNLRGIVKPTDIVIVDHGAVLRDYHLLGARVVFLKGIG